MKEPRAPMHARAPITGPIDLPRKHLVLLVLLVLLLHLWGLSGMPLWLSPDARQPVRTAPLITRSIEVDARATAPIAPPKTALVHPSVAPATTPVAATPQQPAPETNSQEGGQVSTSAKPLTFDDFGQLTSAPVSLPAPNASGVDLPPFQRATGEGLTEVSQFTPPESALLQYQVLGQAKGFNYSASAELNWQQDGQSYEARLEVSAFLLGSRVQVSKGRLGEDGLMPNRFGDKTRSELAAHFQRDKGIISFSANSPDAPLLKGAQDRLSVVLQLSSLLAAEPTRFPADTMLSFQTVSQREAEVWQFLVEQEELLSLPFGDISALKLKRKPRREFDQLIELWFAPSLGYLPVRLRITNANGDFVDQLLRKVEKNSP